MYNGSHAKANNKPRIRMNKLAILFIAVVMLIGAVVGSTVAFLVTKTDPVENKFTYASISTQIDEKFNGETKKDVQVINNGDTARVVPAILQLFQTIQQHVLRTALTDITNNAAHTKHLHTDRSRAKRRSDIQSAS